MRALMPNLRNTNFYIMLLLDALVFGLSLWTAYLFRFDFSIPSGFAVQLLRLLPYAVAVKLGVFLIFGMYRGMWRYTSLGDLWKLLRLSFLQSGALLSLMLFVFQAEAFPRSVFILDWGLSLGMTAALRVAIRVFYARSLGRAVSVADRKRVLVIGAGDDAEKIIREMMDSHRLNYEPVGLIDEDRAKRGRTIHGAAVLGGLDSLEDAVDQYRVDEIFIAVSEATPEAMRAMVERCKGTGLPYRILPAMSEIMDGRVDVKALRDIRYLDLLGRSQVNLDTGRIQSYLSGRTVLVTGCGGSIGSELCRQIVRFKPSRLVLVDAGEYNLYQIEMELVHEFGVGNLVTVLGNITDAELMNRVFAEYRPSVVFHAAAYKHVPMLERNPWQAVRNNILGSRVVMETAVAHGVDRFVVVSTDKAVRPTNVMGASKRVTELLMREYQGRGTRFMAVRFGNVLGSSGSVVPLFRRQIEKGGPVTVTHPEVTRYFMSIAEAAQLILQAGSMGEPGNGGEIFVLDMGVPVKIADMARDLIRLSGKEPDVDVEIAFTGLREGEKLYEELITEGEGIVRTEHDKILVLGPAAEVGSPSPDLGRAVGDLLAAASAHDGAAIRELLAILVPEYTPGG
ncbi:polysaccharide biosynthesis protein [Salidesulfovibrio onnuriiensis]|uniref:polysaccharide biosynthesis protein n=1 Tax=Salidesulfovibrio onnuriiensis TaxID=2583823 RepID=UPI00164FB8BB|nr:nucleoside-diphosphate sugar epimerase/dehydratase [Salidesulfovibrio onnuriiensis]